MLSHERTILPSDQCSFPSCYLASDLLWVLFETGMTVSELCALRLADLDQYAGLLRVRGKGGKERQMPLGATCLSRLRAYLKQMEPTTKRGLARRHVGGDPLFGPRGSSRSPGMV